MVYGKLIMYADDTRVSDVKDYLREVPNQAIETRESLTKYDTEIVIKTSSKERHQKLKKWARNMKQKGLIKKFGEKGFSSNIF